MLFIFCMITVQEPFSQSEKFGPMIYNPPTGWKVMKYQNGVQLITTGPLAKELISINYAANQLLRYYRTSF